MVGEGTTTTVKDTSLQVVGIGALSAGLAQIQAGGDAFVTGLVMTVIGIAVLVFYTKGYIARE